jgi:hypothetical protein
MKAQQLSRVLGPADKPLPTSVTVGCATTYWESYSRYGIAVESEADERGVRRVTRITFTPAFSRQSGP